jgi:hypothetical protein
MEDPEGRLRLAYVHLVADDPAEEVVERITAREIPYVLSLHSAPPQGYSYPFFGCPAQPMPI